MWSTRIRAVRSACIHAGDCFIQPPEIRHRVLEASDGIEVIEIGVPAEHVTEIDHDMTLPTPHHRPDREWEGQRFVHNVAPGRQLARRAPSGLRRPATPRSARQHRGRGRGHAWLRPTGEASPWTMHDADILFTFVMTGEMTLEGEGKDPFRLSNPAMPS